jgi:DNA repair exonuclease SbcCD nuclease subunit
MDIVVGDPHFGKKHFSLALFENQLLIWDEIVKKANELNARIFCMGDLFDNRLSMDINFFNQFIDKFIGLLKRYDVEFYTILGNHDLYFKSTRDINLVKYLPNFYKKIYVIDKITHIDNYTLVPWIIDKEKDIPKEYNKIVMGHFEFKDIDKYVQGSLDLKTFSKADLVISGHYHNYSKKDNIVYIGTPYQMDWGDYKQKKGYYILDGNNLEFIENKVSKKFIKLKYNESFNKPLIISGLEEKDLYFGIDEIPFDILEKNIFKFFINEAKTKDYQKVIYELSKRNLNFEVINNVEMSNILEVEYKPKEIEIKNENILELIPKKYQKLIEKISNFKGEK